MRILMNCQTNMEIETASRVDDSFQYLTIVDVTDIFGIPESDGRGGRGPTIEVKDYSSLGILVTKWRALLL